MKEKIYYREIGRDKMYKTWHTSSDNMVIYMNSDGGSIVFNNKIYPITNGTLCFIGAEKYHYTMPEIPDKYCRSKIFISPGDSLRIFSALPESHLLMKTFSSENAVCAVLPEELREEADALFKSVNSLKNNEKYLFAQLCSCYIRLLIMLDLYTCEPPVTHPDFAFKAIEYINNNISYSLSIDEICRHLHISKYHFCRKFKSALGLTPMEYILKTRLMHAKSMLADESTSISDISDKCGFSSVSYFCRAFKEAENKTPLQFRKEFSREALNTHH